MHQRPSHQRSGPQVLLAAWAPSGRPSGIEERSRDIPCQNDWRTTDRLLKMSIENPSCIGA